MILHYSLLICLLPLMSAQNATISPISPATIATEGAQKVPEKDFTEATVLGKVAEGHSLVSGNPNETNSTFSDFGEPSATIESITVSASKENTIEVLVNLTTSRISNVSNTEASIEAVDATTQNASSLLTSLTSDDDDDDSSQSMTTVRQEASDESSTKSSKAKKKILTTRSKTSTEKTLLPLDKPENGTKSIENKDLNENNSTESNLLVKNTKLTSFTKNDGTSRSIDSSSRSFRFPEEAKPTTERYNIQLTTGSLILSNIQKLVNNNLLNVIDSTSKSEQVATENIQDSAPARNTIKFEADDFSSTGQSDWVPVVSDKTSDNGAWSPVPSFGRTTMRTNTGTPTPSINIDKMPPKEPVSSSMQAIIVRDTETTPAHIGNNKHNQLNVTTDMKLPEEGTAWSLATILLTRTTPNVTTETPKMNHSPIILALNSTLQRKIKESLLRTTTPIPIEINNVENITKEHNQVLKNTIPDTIVKDSTPSPRWRPIVTTSKSIFYTKPLNTTNTNQTEKDISTEVNSTNESLVDIEKTMSLEILKVTTTTTTPYPKQSTSEVITENSNVIEEDNQNSTDVRVSSNSEASVVNSVETTDSIKNYNTVLSNEETATEKIMHTTAYIPTLKPSTTASTLGTSKVTSTSKSQETTISETAETNTPALIIPSTIPPLSSSTHKVTTSKISEKPNEVTKPSPTRIPIFTTTTETHYTTIKIIPTEKFDETTTTRPFAEIEAGVETVTNEEDNRIDDDNRTTLASNTTNFEEFVEDGVPAYLRLTVQTSEVELCHLLPELRTAILKMLSEGTQTNVSSKSLILINLSHHVCNPVLKNAKPEDADVRLRPVNMFLRDDTGGFNKNLSEAFLSLWGHAGLDFPLPILKVDFVTPVVKGEMSAGVSNGVVIAIAISCVAGLCLILLGILFVIMKRRQKKFNYGQRCTPVSLDAYSLDSVSIRNSSRRKGARASKRSYGNAAFDDPVVSSHVLNFAALANFSSEKELIHEEFSGIPQVSPKADEYPPGIETKNRYANVIPLPETRVILSAKDGEALSDYVNANFVKGINNIERTYIAAQAPLESTLADWWRMVWEQQVKVILMLTALSENGVEKCAEYLPPSEVTDNIRLFGDFQVTLKKRDVKEKYIVSTLQLKNMDTNLWREVTHLWYLGWPDSGVPAEPNSLIAFLIEARSQIKTSSGSPAPTLVHCSPGTGRTGTVIACDVCIREFEQNRVVDIPRCVYYLRRARAGAVQTRDQYAFIYMVLNTYATKLTGGALETI